MNESLQAISTKYLTTPQIENSLLTAEIQGKDQLMKFVETRLLPTVEPDKRTSFYDPIKRNNVLTFKTIYGVQKTSKDKRQTTPT